MIRFYLSLFGTFTFFLIQAQPASIQDCLGAIPICQQIYQGDPIPLGNGNVTDFDADDTCLPFEIYSIWYTFTVNNSGQFGFILTPNDPAQDFDWVLFDITNASCEDLFDNPSLVVSCNAAGDIGCHGPTGATGATPYNNQGPDCGNFPPNVDEGYNTFNDLVDVEAGNTYVLCISNFSVTAQGYTLDFGLSAGIGIYDDTPPALDTVAYQDSCNSQEVLVRFSEYIQCSTIDASNFQLSGPGGPYSLTLSSVNCDAGGKYSKEFFLHISPPIPPGAMVNLALVVDGSTEALDMCDNPSSPASLSFEAPLLSQQADLGPDTAICSGVSVILKSNLSGTHLWSDGSTGLTLEVSAPGIYWVNITTPCGTASDTIQISESADIPVVNLGNDTILCPSETLVLDATTPGVTYMWQNGSTAPTLSVVQPGIYKVTVTNTCGEDQDEINVTFADPISVELSDTSLCPGESVSFDVTTAGASYLWQDGSTNATFTATTPGTYSVTISNACEAVELSAEVQETAIPVPNINLGNDTILCPGENLLLELNIPGVSFLWQDGSANASFLVTQAGAYSVSVSNGCGESQDEINVGFVNPISVELSDTSLCPGESVSFDVTTAGASYLWQDGSTNATYTALTPGTYSVTISNACEAVELSAEVQETATPVPNINLGSDTILCPGENLLLELNIPGVSFLWQDGSVNASFLVNQAGTYSVSVSNECGESQDEINVDFADPIMTELSDTSLCPGKSVSFDVTTAGASYLWQDGSTTPTYSVTTPGTYSVTISNACETVELSAEVQESAVPIPDFNLGNDTTLCPGETLFLELNIPGVSFLWQDGTESDYYKVTSTGNYSVAVSNECESRSDDIQVVLLEPITINLIQDTILCPGETLLLDVTDENASSYSWQDHSSEPVYLVREPGTYTVHVANTCETVALSVNVEACEICNVYVPNAFSPNDDGVSDVFQPYLNCLVENFNLKIFNRWGALIFETSSTENGWDGTLEGKMLDNGVYIYVLQLSVQENDKTRNIDLSGDITLIK